jgi:pyruvate kinase
VTNNQKAHTQLSVVYGIHAVYARFPEGVFTMKSAPNPVFEKLKKEKIIVRGEKVLITHGQFWQTPGATNTVAIITVD